MTELRAETSPEPTNPDIQPLPARSEAVLAMPERREWPKAVAAIGWVVVYIAIHSTAHTLLQIGFDAVGVATTSTGPTSGDEKNPPGQFLAIAGAIAAGLLITLLLRRWYHDGAGTEPGRDLEQHPNWATESVR